MWFVPILSLVSLLCCATALWVVFRARVREATVVEVAAPPVPVPPPAQDSIVSRPHVDARYEFPKPRMVNIRTVRGSWWRKIIAVERMQPYDRIRLVLDQPITDGAPDDAMRPRATHVLCQTLPKDSPFMMNGNVLRAKTNALPYVSLMYEYAGAQRTVLAGVEAYADTIKPLCCILGSLPHDAASSEEAS